MTFVDFIRAGGMGMWVVMGLGIATLLVSILFARNPDPRRMALVRGLTTASLFSIATAVASNLSTVGFQVPAHAEWSHSPDIHLIVMTGIAESLTPAILGGAFLTLTWIVTAVGMRRLGDRLGALAEA